MKNPFKSHKKLWITLAVSAILLTGFCIFGCVKIAQELASAPSVPPALWTEVAPIIMAGDEKKSGHLVKAEFDIVEAEKCTAEGKRDAAVEKMKSACEEMRECFGTKSICYATALLELSGKERNAGRSQDAKATMEQCLAALPENGAESLGIILREQSADSLAWKFFKNQKEILELRRQNVIAGEKLYKQDRKNSQLFITALNNLSRDQETADLLQDAITTRLQEQKVLQECNLQERKDYPECLVCLGRIELKNGNYIDPEKYLKESIAWFAKYPAEAQKPGAAPIYVHAYDTLAKVYVRRHEYEEAEKYFRETIKIAFRVHTISSPFYQTLGRFLRSQGNLQECDTVLKQGLARSQSEAGPRGRAGGFSSVIIQDLAITAALRGDRAYAKYYFNFLPSTADMYTGIDQTSAHIWGADFNELNKRGRRPKSFASLQTIVVNPVIKHLTYPEYLITRQDFKCLLEGIAVPIECSEEPAQTSEWQKDIALATTDGDPQDKTTLAVLNRALTIAKGFHPGDRRISITYNRLGRYYLGQENYLQAEVYFKKAVAACEQEPQEYLSQVEFGKLLDSLGTAMHSEKNYDAAGPVLLRSVKVLTPELEQGSFLLQQSRAHYAGNLISQGKLAEARAVYSQMLSKGAKYKGGTDFACQGRAKVALAFICEKEGKFDEASDYCRELSAIQFLPPDLQYRTAKVSAALLEHNGKTAEDFKERARMLKMRETFGTTDRYLDDW